MAIYYTINAKGFDPKKRLASKSEVCLEIRINQLTNYCIYEKDDSQMKSTQMDTAVILPIAPMCKDITSEIDEILASYKRIEEEQTN